MNVAGSLTQNPKNLYEQEGGYLVTPPMIFHGHCLEMNINVSAMGGAVVEIQDEAAQPIPGYTHEDWDRFLMNDVL